MNHTIPSMARYSTPTNTQGLSPMSATSSFSEPLTPNSSGYYDASATPHGVATSQARTSALPTNSMSRYGYPSIERKSTSPAQSWTMQRLRLNPSSHDRSTMPLRPPQPLPPSWQRRNAYALLESPLEPSVYSVYNLASSMSPREALSTQTPEEPPPLEFQSTFARNAMRSNPPAEATPCVETNFATAPRSVSFQATVPLATTELLSPPPPSRSRLPSPSRSFSPPHSPSQSSHQSLPRSLHQSLQQPPLPLRSPPPQYSTPAPWLGVHEEASLREAATLGLPWAQRLLAEVCLAPRRREYSSNGGDGGGGAHYPGRGGGDVPSRGLDGLLDSSSSTSSSSSSSSRVADFTGPGGGGEGLGDGLASFDDAPGQLEDGQWPRDAKQGFHWASLAAVAGDKRGQVLLAQCFERGLGCTRNWSDAVKWYSLYVCDSESPPQQLRGPSSSSSPSTPYFSRVDRGLSVASDNNTTLSGIPTKYGNGINLPGKYANGHGQMNPPFTFGGGTNFVDKSPSSLGGSAVGTEQVRRSETRDNNNNNELQDPRSGPSEEADSYGACEAAYVCGMMLLRGGHGLAAQPPKALPWLFLSGEQGFTPAMCALGRLCIDGYGLALPPNLEAAREWYGRAATMGNAQAQLQLGTLLAQGAGGPRDVARAYELWRKAASAGLASAKRNLERADRCFVGVKFE